MANQSNFQKMMRRARWDRLGCAFVVLILLIVIICAISKGCSKKKDAGETKPASADSSTTSVIDVVETTQPPTMPKNNTNAIYLSPSTQEDNLYACDESINEEMVMFDLANAVRALLEADGYTVYMCEDTDNVKNKVVKGNELGCGAYIALHSNANENEVGGQGTECFYNSTITGSRALAENVYNRVAELTPTEDRGLKDETQRDLYEIINNRYPCCLLEVEFHDNADGSQWILDNQDALAKAIKDGIVAYMKNKEAGSTPAPSDELTDSFADSLAESDAGAGEANGQ